MAKRKETIELENALHKMTRDKRIYGCEEITIGFYGKGHGNEIVDYMTMDSKGIIKCYELKVTLQDLKSNAKKSWYGNYNYLVVGNDLFNKVKDFTEYIPDHIGLIVGNNLESVRKAKNIPVEYEIEIMLKESLVRSMFWKMIKNKDAQSLDKQKQLNSKIRKIENEKDSYYKRMCHAENLIYDYERYKSRNDNINDVNFELIVREEREKFRQKRQSIKM